MSRMPFLRSSLLHHRMKMERFSVVLNGIWDHTEYFKQDKELGIAQKEMRCGSEFGGFQFNVGCVMFYTYTRTNKGKLIKKKQKSKARKLIKQPKERPRNNKYDIDLFTNLTVHNQFGCMFNSSGCVLGDAAV